MSLRIIHEMLSEENVPYLDIYNLGFILTVIRDNCLNEETSSILDKYVNELWEICKNRSNK